MVIIQRELQLEYLSRLNLAISIAAVVEDSDVLELHWRQASE